MEIEINNKVDNNIIGKEVTDFINELSSTLEKELKLDINTNLYNEIMKDVELAPKYQKELQSTIDKCLKDLSYEKDFFYFDYDKEIKEYNLKYFWNGGNIICDNLSPKDIQEYKNSGYTFFIPIDEDGTVMEADSLKDWIKCEVESALLDMDIKNKESKGT